MNPEIYTTVENMKRGKKESLATSDILVYQLSQMAHLLSLLAEESEKVAIKTEKATKWIVRLTWVIAILTAVLVLTIFFEFPKFSIQPIQFPSLRTEQNQKNDGNSKIQRLPQKSQTIPDVSKGIYK